MVCNVVCYVYTKCDYSLQNNVNLLQWNNQTISLLYPHGKCIETFNFYGGININTIKNIFIKNSLMSKKITRFLFYVHYLSLYQYSEHFIIKCGMNKNDKFNSIQ